MVFGPERYALCMVCPVWRPCDPTVPPTHPSRSPAGPGTRAGGAVTPLVTQQPPAAEFGGLSVAVLGQDCRFGAIWRRMAARGPCLERQGPMSRCPVPSRPLRIVRVGGEGPSPPSRWSSLALSGARFAWCARFGAHVTLLAVPPRHPSRSPPGPATRSEGAITPLVAQQPPAAEFGGLSVAVLGPNCRLGAVWGRMAA